MKVRVRPLLSCLLLILSVFVTSGFGESYAATAAPPSTSGSGASGLSISPLRQNITLKPGQATSIPITLKNITGEPIVAKAGVRNFQSDGVTGNPKIITNTNYNDPASIKNFLVGLGNVDLAVNQQETIQLPVQAPANAAPGAYYGLITYQAVPDTSKTSAAKGDNVALSAAVSQLVFITVPGNVSQSLQINAIHIYKDTNGATAGGILFTKPPKTVGVQIHNFGNAFASPYGTVVVKKGSKQVYTYQLNNGITRGLLLPNSSRVFINAVKKITTPGHYTVQVNATYGKGSTILTAQKSFWYIPVWLILIIILVIILILVGLWMLRLHFKKPGKTSYKK
jgi:hypothetical protein